MTSKIKEREAKTLFKKGKIMNKEKVSQKTEERILQKIFGVLVLFLIITVGYLYHCK